MSYPEIVDEKDERELLSRLIKLFNDAAIKTGELYEEGNLLKDVKVKNVYYAGGTLCIDTNKAGLAMLNISDECIIYIENGKETKRLMNLDMLYFSFITYLVVKGKTEYYLECFNKSCVRHLFNDNMFKYDTAEYKAMEAVEEGFKEANEFFVRWGLNIQN